MKYRLNLAFFVLLAFLILLAVHFVVFFGLINFFSITTLGSRLILIAVLLFLGLSSFVSTILAHWRENLTTKIYYTLSCFWLGVLTNLVVGMFVASILAGATSMVYPRLRFPFFGNAVLLFAGIYSIYGVWNATRLRVKRLAIPLPNLPEAWRGRKIVQLSDLHLGHIRGEKFFRKIVAETNAERPDLVVITGDLFDGMDGNLDNLASGLNDIQSARGIYFITGNHETYLGTGLAFKALENTGVIHVHDEVVDLDGLKLISVDYPDLSEKKSLPEVLNGLKPKYLGHPNILLCHSPVSIEKVKDSGVNLMLSGHTHQGQIFPLRFITRLVFKGYDYGLHKLGDFYLYTTSGAGTSLPPMRTGCRPEIVAITLKPKEDALD